MIRNVLVFLAGALVALALVYLSANQFVQTTGGKFLLDTVLGLRGLFGGPGSGSGIRVVGGSLKVSISPTYSWPSEPSTTNELVLANSDARTFGLEYIRQKLGGPQIALLTYPPLSDTWTIVELVKDNNGGVRISGTVGSTQSNGTVTFDTINNKDSFVKQPPIAGQKRAVYCYHDQTCPVDPKDPCDENCPASKLTELQVTVGGSTDIWYCSDGVCHVDIGSRQ